MRPAVTAPIDDEPMPPARRRRWCAATAVMVLLPVVTWCGWDWIAWHRFNAEVARLHAAGEPVWAAEFPKAELPDSENAAVFIRRAAEEYVETPEERSHYQDNVFAGPLTPEVVAALGHLLEANRSALEDVRRAQGLSIASAWEPPPTIEDVVHGRGFELLNRSRSLAQLLGYAALHARATDDDRASIRFIEEIIAVGTATDANQSLSAHPMAEGMRSMACEEVERLAPELRIGDGPRDARRSEVVSLIAELVDANPRREGMRRAIEHERPTIAAPATDELISNFRHAYGSLGAAGNVSWFMAPRVLDAATDRLIRPLLLLRSARMLRQDAVAAATAPAADAGALPPPANPAPRYPLHLLEMFGVNWVMELRISDWDQSGVFWDHRATTAANARAAVSLATRMYQADHDGRRPASTAFLVPTYLPGIPAGVPAVPTPTLPATVPAATQPAAK